MRNIQQVLVAEDTEDDRFFLKHALQKSGLDADNIRIMTDGTEAVDYLERAAADPVAFPPPDLIFTDLKMPILNGFELLAWLKKSPTFANVPTVVLTSSDNNDDVKRAYSAGANSFIQKPTHLNEMMRKIQQTVEYWDSNQLK